jgi:RND family efflux transporter MFP subunit
MNKRSKKRFTYGFLVLILLAIAGGGILLKVRGKSKKDISVPTTDVKRGEFIDYVELRGEIAVRSSTVITAPANAGNLQIIKLALNGSHVKKGDFIAEFDASTLKRNAEQARSTLKQVESEIAKAKAQQLLSEEQIKTELMSAEFALERARLDAGTRDVIPAIESEKHVLEMQKAEQKLRELKSKIESRRIGTEADMAAIVRRRAKAQADLDQAESNMAALTLTSPADGILTFLPNSNSRAVYSGSAPVYKEGDRAYSGNAIAEIPDLSTIEAKTAVLEADRGRVKPGQPAILNVEAVPDREQHGRIKEISPLAQLDYSDYITIKNFAVAIELENPDLKLRPGMMTGVRIEVERIHNAIAIPSDAVFSKNGRTIAYVLYNGSFQERPLTLARRGNSQVMVSNGLTAGELIALKDPTEE